MTGLLEQLRASLADRYVLERELGRGGMATVYLAQDRKHHRRVALKVLHPELAHALGPERFRREIETAARLQHPHILTVLDSGEAVVRGESPLLYYTMPYVDGESLRARLQREARLPLDEAVRITREVALALDYAHRQGVIHRDVKPENILLSDGQALLADFGIAKALGAAADDRLTGTGLALGTPAYMSPEQAAGSAAFDGRSDQYSLGCVLYEMLAGAAPFTGRTPQAVIARRLVAPPPSLRRVRPAVPKPLERVVLRALAREPDDRFPSLVEFAGALGTGPLAATGGTRTASALAARWIPGRPVLLIGLAALLGLGAGAALLRQTRAAPKVLKADLVAVAPFDVLDPALGLWHEGLVDVLARDLDGAGPLRTVSPTVIVRAWRGRADPASALALGRRTGAGLTIYGSLVRSGADSVRIAATVLDVTRDRALGEFEVRGPLAHMDRLTDTLAVGALRAIARARPVGAMRHTGLGARSLPALKAFLQAEQYYRRGLWDSAQVYAQQAVELDTTFAQAYRLLAGSISFRINRPQELDPLSYSLRAGALNRGLGPRDSLLVLSDSLLAAVLSSNAPDPSREAPGPALGARLVEVVEEAAHSYPEDPAVWHNLGEVRHHFGGWLVRSGGWRTTLAAFERSIAADSLFGPAYIHPIELSYAMDDTAQAHRLIAAVTRNDPQCGNCAGFAAVRRVLALRDSAARARVLDTLPADVLRVMYVTLARWPDADELPIGILRRILPRDEGFAQGGLIRTLVLRGHLREAIALGDTMMGFITPIVFAEAALVGSVPAERASSTFAGWLREGSFWSVLALPWWSARRDTLALDRFLRLVERTTRAVRSGPGRSPEDSAWAARMSAIARAHLALARRDTVTALRAYEPLRSGFCPWWCQADRLTFARLLAEDGRLTEAAAILSAPSTLESEFEPRPTDVLWYLERGRTAERLGDRPRALEAYGHVAAAWRHSDPELEPYAAEARAGLNRLTAQLGL